MIEGILLLTNDAIAARYQELVRVSQD